MEAETADGQRTETSAGPERSCRKCRVGLKTNEQRAAEPEVDHGDLLHRVDEAARFDEA
jgi:hypothetical protein